MTGSVLVVDDDSAIRTVVAAALRREGHAVTTAASLAELRRAIGAALPDVLVTDVVLPDGNGLDEVARLTAEHPALPVIVFSARNTLATAVRATEVGAFDYLPSRSTSTCSARRCAAPSPAAATPPPRCPRRS